MTGARSFGYGPPGSFVYLAGDREGDGIDTPGLFDTTTASWFRRDESSSGAADLLFIYGAPGAFPVAGDWNG